MLGVFTLSSCHPETREEGRLRRLETFRSCLTPQVEDAFDSISCREDCDSVGLLLRESLEGSPELQVRMDSILQAEMIESFSYSEVVYYFWYYFDNALESGSVRGP